MLSTVRCVGLVVVCVSIAIGCGSSDSDTGGGGSSSGDGGASSSSSGGQSSSDSGTTGGGACGDHGTGCMFGNGFCEDSADATKDSCEKRSGVWVGGSCPKGNGYVGCCAITLPGASSPVTTYGYSAGGYTTEGSKKTCADAKGTFQGP